MFQSAPAGESSSNDVTTETDSRQELQKQHLQRQDPQLHVSLWVWLLRKQSASYQWLYSTTAGTITRPIPDSGRFTPLHHQPIGSTALETSCFRVSPDDLDEKASQRKTRRTFCEAETSCNPQSSILVEGQESWCAKLLSKLSSTCMCLIKGYWEEDTSTT